jgi:arylsulfatase A-like enzyme
MPAWVHWPGVIPPASTSLAAVSSLDLLPSLLHLVGMPQPSGRLIDGTLSLADAIMGDGTLPSRHDFLPLYNNPVYGNASRAIFAARSGRYKVHWISSPGLTPNSGKHPSPEMLHDPPLVFDVEADPSEAFPLSDTVLPAGLLTRLGQGKAKAESLLQPTSISPAWGYAHALCCGIGCTAPCTCVCKDVPLPLA